MGTTPGAAPMVRETLRPPNPRLPAPGAARRGGAASGPGPGRAVDVACAGGAPAAAAGRSQDGGRGAPGGVGHDYNCASCKKLDFPGLFGNTTHVPRANPPHTKVEEMTARLEEAERGVARAEDERATLVSRAEEAERASRDAAAQRQRQLADVTNLRWGEAKAAYGQKAAIWAHGVVAVGPSCAAASNKPHARAPSLPKARNAWAAARLLPCRTALRSVMGGSDAASQAGKVFVELEHARAKESLARSALSRRCAVCGLCLSGVTCRAACGTLIRRSPAPQRA
jgi:hypothetical protein